MMRFLCWVMMVACGFVFRVGAVEHPPSAPAAPEPGRVLYVAADGSGDGDGSEARPFGDLEAARDAVRALKRQGGLPAGGVEVRVHGGVYRVRQTLELGPEDSGTAEAPVAWRAAAGEVPVFRGGVRLAGFHAVTDPGLRARIPEAVRDRVLQADLAAAGVTNLPALVLGGFASGRGFRTHAVPELFFNGTALRRARWPNEGTAAVSAVSTNQVVKGYDRTGSRDGWIRFDDPRLARWVSEPELWLHGYWFWDWADSYEKVSTVDPSTGRMTLEPPLHGYGYAPGQPFCVWNALSELDAPGEWYLDRATRSILFYPPADPASAELALSLLAGPFLRAEGVRHLRWEGLTFEWGASDGLLVRDAEHVILAGCTVRYGGGNGMELTGSRDSMILSCDVYGMGRGGIILSGGDRKTLEPGRLTVANCRVYDLSRIDRTYTPGVLVQGVGNRVVHNRLEDIPSSALRVGGNDHEIAYNQVFRVVRESDDQGGVDMWGDPAARGIVYRYNHFREVGSRWAGGEDVKLGQAGIRLDDAICGVVITGNVFERCGSGKRGFGAVQIHGGKDNLVESNLFVGCEAVLSCSPWSAEKWTDFVKDRLDKPDVDRDLYLRRYPALARLLEAPNLNTLRNNLAVNCGELLRHAPANLVHEGNALIADDAPLEDLLKRPDAPAIPFGQIGLYPDPWRKVP